MKILAYLSLATAILRLLTQGVALSSAPQFFAREGHFKDLSKIRPAAQLTIVVFV
jgi:hypothetical protein